MSSTASHFNRKHRANSPLRKLSYNNMNLMFSFCFVKCNFVEVEMEAHTVFLIWGGKNTLFPGYLILNRRYSLNSSRRM